MIGRSLLLAATALLATPAAVQAQAAAKPSAVYVFGDSLSDRGNLAELLGPFPNPPSYHDSFTNGDVAVQVMAQRAGLSVDPSAWVTGFKDVRGLFGGTSFVPGTNYAVAGATAAAQAAGGPASINLPQQLAAYTGLLAAAGTTADPNALYTVLIGGNDVRNAAKVTTTVAGVTTTVAGAGATAVTNGVQAELGVVQGLINLGAKNLLVINVPDVGVIPEFTQDNPTFAASATMLSKQYDVELAAGLAGLTLNGASLKQFDLYTYNQNLGKNAAALGFTDTTDRCYTSTPFTALATAACGVNGANINGYIYWDAIHPTARVDAITGNALADFVGLPAATSVPEPAGWALFILGFGAAGTALRRRRVRVSFAA